MPQYTDCHLGDLGEFRDEIPSMTNRPESAEVRKNNPITRTAIQSSKEEAG